MERQQRRQQGRSLLLQSMFALETAIIGLEAEVARIRAAFSRVEESVETLAPVLPAQRELLTKLTRSVDDVNITVAARNCLKVHNVTTIGELVQKNRDFISEGVHYQRRRTLKELEEMLAKMGISIGMELPPEVLEALKEK